MFEKSFVEIEKRACNYSQIEYNIVKGIRLKMRIINMADERVSLGKHIL